jgi:hypothetical protein
MKKTSIISSMALGCLALAMGLVLAPEAQAAKPVNSTLTGQSIMVNLDAAGTFTIHENQTWKYDEDVAAALFTNLPDGNAPAVSCSSQTSGPTSTFEAAPQPVASACDPTVNEPPVPAPDATELNTVGKSDVVGQNKCNFLDGTPLIGATYTQTVKDVTAQCVFVSDSDTHRSRMVQMRASIK